MPLAPRPAFLGALLLAALPEAHAQHFSVGPHLPHPSTSNGLPPHFMLQSQMMAVQAAVMVLAPTPVGGYLARHPAWTATLHLGDDGRIVDGAGVDRGAWVFVGASLTLQWADAPAVQLNRQSDGSFVQGGVAFTLTRLTPAGLVGAYERTVGDVVAPFALHASGRAHAADGADVGAWSWDAGVLVLDPRDGPVERLAVQADGRFRSPTSELVLTRILRSPAAGNYSATHPEWQGTLRVRSNGLVDGPEGRAGTWVGDATKLVIAWTEGAPVTLYRQRDGRLTSPVAGLALVRQAPAELVGTWEAVLGEWRGAIKLQADGRMLGSDGAELGPWSFDGTTLVLAWFGAEEDWLARTTDGRFVQASNGLALTRQ